jgi:hypothetical protein
LSVGTIMEILGPSSVSKFLDHLSQSSYEN